jgi:hypothetical protein
MLTENTVSKLHEMKLSVMAQSFCEQMTNHEFVGLSFEDRFSLLVDSEWTSRKSNRLNRLIRSAEYSIPDASNTRFYAIAKFRQAVRYIFSYKQLLRVNIALFHVFSCAGTVKAKNLPIR